MPEREYKSPNTRQYKRMFADYLVKYRLAGGAGQNPFVSNIKDISAGGVRFWTEELLLEGALLMIEVLVPPIGRVIKALGRIVRIRPAGDGTVYYAAIRFVEISEEDQSALNYLIERIASERGGRALVPDEPVVKRKIFQARIF